MMRRRRVRRSPERRPLVPVVSAKEGCGRTSFLGPDTYRRTWWWELALGCGHTVYCSARYTRPGYQHTHSDLAAPPTRARCDECPRGESA